MDSGSLKFRKVLDQPPEKGAGAGGGGAPVVAIVFDFAAWWVGLQSARAGQASATNAIVRMKTRIGLFL
jgi:hypothetical protein